MDSEDTTIKPMDAWIPTLPVLGTWSFIPNREPSRFFANFKSIDYFHAVFVASHDRISTVISTGYPKRNKNDQLKQ